MVSEPDATEGEQLHPSAYDEVPEKSEQLDQDPFQPDYGLNDRGVDDALDEGLTTPERWSALERHGEEETLDQRLSEELPDDSEPLGESALHEPAPDSDATDDQIDDGEVGDQRAGRLIDPDEGIGEDDEAEMIGDDAGIDAGAASAEEAAVHVVDEEYER